MFSCYVEIRLSRSEAPGLRPGCRGVCAGSERAPRVEVLNGPMLGRFEGSMSAVLMIPYRHREQ